MIYSLDDDEASLYYPRKINTAYLLSKYTKIKRKSRTCGMCGGQSGTGSGLLRVFRFPLPILITPTAPLVHTRLSTAAGTICQIVAEVQSGLCLTPSQEIK
jgi:hypothetical protein